ncbi:MAG: hypothetical protein ACRDMZ_14395, partial [Solirubrobacteraceae bacterium]
MTAFPPIGLTRIMLLAGAAAASAMIALLVAEMNGDILGFAWGLPFAGAYVAGAVAVRARP